MKSQRVGKFQAAIHATTRLVLGGVFIYAALSKFKATHDFAYHIASYQILPAPIVNLWALGLPLFELICGLLLITGYLRRIGLLSVTGMLIIFLLAMLSAEVRGLPLTCGCFGPRSWLDANLWVSMARDLVLLLSTVCTYRHYLLCEMPPVADLLTNEDSGSGQSENLWSGTPARSATQDAFQSDPSRQHFSRGERQGRVHEKAKSPAELRPTAT